MNQENVIQPPACTADFKAFETSFKNLESAYTSKNHRQTIQLALSAVDHIFQRQLIAVLDYKAFYFGMNSQVTQVVKDAREIITYKPTLATGCLRLGSLYHMQYKRKDVIEAYSLGLQSVFQDDPDHAQLICGK